MDAFAEYLLGLDGGKLIAVLGLLFWVDMRKTVISISHTLQTLSIQLATIVERVDSHEKRIDKLEGSN
jgi:hypothetical protein